MGNIISFRANRQINISSCKAYFSPLQHGNGDPSPDNKMPINGRTSVYINRLGNNFLTIYPVTWESLGTIFGGYVDIITGELVETWAIQTFNGTVVSSVDTVNEFTRFWTQQGNNQIDRDTNKNDTVMCDTASVTTLLDEINNPTKPLLYVTAYPASYCVALPTSLIGSTVDSIKAYLADNPITIAFERETPVIHQLKPQQIKTLVGQNSIWSNVDMVDVKFGIQSNFLLRRHRMFFKDFLDEVEWVDHAYISSGGKYQSAATATSHYTQNAILLKPGTYKLVGFSYQEDAGESNKTNFRIHAYNASDKWQRQITYKLIGWMSPVDISFTLTSDTYVRLSIGRKFIGNLVKVK